MKLEAILDLTWKLVYSSDNQSIHDKPTFYFAFAYWSKQYGRTYLGYGEIKLPITNLTKTILGKAIRTQTSLSKRWIFKAVFPSI